MFRLECETHRTVQIEDHQFWVGRVTRVNVVGGAEDMNGVGTEEVFSLMYSDRHFRYVGDPLVPSEGSGEVEGNMDDGSLPSGELGAGSGR